VGRCWGQIAGLWRNSYGLPTCPLTQTEPLHAKRLRDLTVQDVEGLLRNLAKRKPKAVAGKQRKAKGNIRGPLGASSLKRVRMALGGALEAERRGLVSRNVARLAYLPATATAAQRPRRSLTPKQVAT